MPSYDVSERERQALRLAADGYSSAEAAETMGVGKLTVDQYLKQARWKLRAKTKTHAVAEALRKGLIE